MIIPISCKIFSFKKPPFSVTSTWRTSPLQN